MYIEDRIFDLVYFETEWNQLRLRHIHSVIRSCRQVPLLINYLDSPTSVKQYRWMRIIDTYRYCTPYDVRRTTHGVRRTVYGVVGMRSAE